MTELTKARLTAVTGGVMLLVSAVLAATALPWLGKYWRQIGLAGLAIGAFGLQRVRRELRRKEIDKALAVGPEKRRRLRTRSPAA